MAAQREPSDARSRTLGLLVEEGGGAETFRAAHAFLDHVVTVVGGQEPEFVVTRTAQAEDERGTFAGQLVVFTSSLVARVEFESIPSERYASPGYEISPVTAIVVPRGAIRAVCVRTGGTALANFSPTELDEWSSFDVVYERLGTVEVAPGLASNHQGLYLSVLGDLGGAQAEG
jgi:hypothetical protein